MEKSDHKSKEFILQNADDNFPFRDYRILNERVSMIDASMTLTFLLC